MRATENKAGVFIEAHNDKHGTSHVNIYDRDPSKGPHESIHINIRSDGTGTIIESSASGKKTPTNIDLNKNK